MVTRKGGACHKTASLHSLKLFWGEDDLVTDCDDDSLGSSSLRGEAGERKEEKEGEKDELNQRRRLEANSERQDRVQVQPGKPGARQDKEQQAFGSGANAGLIKTETHATRRGSATLGESYSEVFSLDGGGCDHNTTHANTHLMALLLTLPSSSSARQVEALIRARWTSAETILRAIHATQSAKVAVSEVSVLGLARDMELEVVAEMPQPSRLLLLMRWEGYWLLHGGYRGQVKYQKIQGRGYPYNKKERLDSPKARFPVLCSAGTAVNSVRVRPRYPGTIRITEGSSGCNSADGDDGVRREREKEPRDYWIGEERLAPDADADADGSGTGTVMTLALVLALQNCNWQTMPMTLVDGLLDCTGSDWASRLSHGSDGSAPEQPKMACRDYRSTKVTWGGTRVLKLRKVSEYRQRIRKVARMRNVIYVSGGLWQQDDGIRSMRTCQRRKADRRRMQRGEGRYVDRPTIMLDYLPDYLPQVLTHYIKKDTNYLWKMNGELHLTNKQEGAEKFPKNQNETPIRATAVKITIAKGTYLPAYFPKFPLRTSNAHIWYVLQPPRYTSRRCIGAGHRPSIYRYIADFTSPAISSGSMCRQTQQPNPSFNLSEPSRQAQVVRSASLATRVAGGILVPSAPVRRLTCHHCRWPLFALANGIPRMRYRITTATLAVDSFLDATSILRQATVPCASTLVQRAVILIKGQASYLARNNLVFTFSQEDRPQASRGFRTARNDLLGGILRFRTQKMPVLSPLEQQTEQRLCPFHNNISLHAEPHLLSSDSGCGTECLAPCNPTSSRAWERRHWLLAYITGKVYIWDKLPARRQTRLNVVRPRSSYPHTEHGISTVIISCPTILAIRLLTYLPHGESHPEPTSYHRVITAYFAEFQQARTQPFEARPLMDRWSNRWILNPTSTQNLWLNRPRSETPVTQSFAQHPIEGILIYGGVLCLFTPPPNTFYGDMLPSLTCLLGCPPTVLVDATPDPSMHSDLDLQWGGTPTILGLPQSRLFPKITSQTVNRTVLMLFPVRFSTVHSIYHPRLALPKNRPIPQSHSSSTNIGNCLGSKQPEEENKMSKCIGTAALQYLSSVRTSPRHTAGQ
ncbi:hypothetical protein CCUS01_00415 [Colletotrichum cuscutae]|uniref:Uncharacterized protein n=1 Tax=Colletotrichum cuscutae TaxID=1209917 RepID=A0AAI9VCM6_9PEZI|nr:hypothetical protein CCUS01_00415 [Colletotrichum cuscutae]